MHIHVHVHVHVLLTVSMPTVVRYYTPVCVYHCMTNKKCGGEPGRYSYMYMYICLFVRDMVGWVILLSFLSCFLKLVCYAHVFPCMYT